MRFTPLITIAAAALTLSACTTVEGASQQGTAAPKWSYAGATGPAAWGRLSPDFALCETGRQGSPIDIRDSIPATIDGPNVNWTRVAGDVVDTGKGIQVNAANTGGFTMGNHRYELLQFHFHTPAEHLLQGRRFPVEAHFVHRRDDGMLGVIGVFVQEGAHNPVLQSMLDELAGRRGAAAQLPITQLLPQGRTFYRYAGSLTTPPCSETVDWVVMEQPITASREQIAALVARYADNARPVQPHHRRFILRSGN